MLRLSSTTVFRHLMCRSYSKSSGSGEFYSETKPANFGFEEVTEKEKAEKVYSVFENVAASYDLMNDAMSMGIHRLWKDHFLKVMNPVPGTKLLDVAGGTGDIAFKFLQYVNSLESTKNRASIKSPLDDDTADLQTHVTVFDINKAMLDVGKKRSNNFGINQDQLSWVCGNAECLELPDNTFDIYSVVFGIRNFPKMENALAEAYRVLKPGGRFLCMEFSKVQNQTMNWIYKNYSFQVIPVLGLVLAQDWKSYQYLVESIELFPNQEQFRMMIQRAGFKMVTYENLTLGVVAIHSGFKV